MKAVSAKATIDAAMIRLAGLRAALARATERVGAMPIAQKPKQAAGLLLDAFIAGLEPRVARFIARDRRVAVVEDDGISLYEIRDGRAEPLGQVGDRVPLSKSGAGALELRLPPERFLQRTLRLPDAGREYLGPILSHRLERLTPWRPDKVLYGWNVAGPAAADGTITVDLVATSADLVAPYLATLAEAGLTVTGLGSAAESLETPLAIDLFRGRNAGTSGDRLRQITARAAVIGFAVLIPVWLATSLIADSAEADRAVVEARLTTLRAKLAQRAGTGGSREQALIVAKRPETAMLTLVDRLSAALPDSTVLRELDADGAKVRLVGHSADASALVGLLESQSPLKQVRFAAPVMRDAERRDAFDIVAARAESTP